MARTSGPNACLGAPYNLAATCVVKSTPGICYRLIVSGCVSNVLTGAVTLKDSATTKVLLNAGTASGSYEVGLSCATNITIILASAGDAVTVMYL